MSQRELEAAGGIYTATDETILSVRDLWVEYRTGRGRVQAVRGANFDLRRGESLALIGESGSGKTTLGLALVRLLPEAAFVPRGSITYQQHGEAVEVLGLDQERLRRFRWEECAMVFQGAQNSLNPVLTILDQFADTFLAHQRESGRAIEARARDLMRDRKSVV